ncbi:MAG: NAD(P)-binding protein [Myxococcota bacterium]
MTKRREMLASLLGGAAASQLLACRRAPDEPESIDGRLGAPDHAFGHRLRDGLHLEEWDDVPEERTRVAIIGGGVAGLAAGWRLRTRGISGVRLYEMESSVGGTARSGQNRHVAFPLGAHYLPLPRRDDRVLRGFLDSMGALEDDEGAEHVLVREPDERVFYRGYWYRGLYPYAGASNEDLAELARFEGEMLRFAQSRGEDGKPAFTLPSRECSTDPRFIELDAIDAETYLAREGYRTARLRWLCDYATRDDYGLALSEASAWALVFYWAARIHEGAEETSEVLTWPSGNAALARALAEPLRGRIDTNVMAVDVRQQAGEVRILLLTPGGARRRVIADRAVLAMPKFIASKIARRAKLPDIGEPTYGPWWVANLHLASRPRGRGEVLAWDNVIYDSPSLGYVTATHQTGRDSGPTVLTYYFPMTGDVSEARQRLMDAELETLQTACLTDLSAPHPELVSRLERLDVWRWGHAMAQPRPGFLQEGARFSAGKASGRIHFAHSDLSGLALFEEAFHHGVRAADEIADAV